MRIFLLILVMLFSLNIIAQDSCLYQYKAVITEVYDGDTVTARIDLGFNVSITEKLRLDGINTPEVRGSERPLGLISRDRLRDKILGREVIVKTLKDKKGKYGRYIAEIMYQGESVNHWLVSEGLAVYKEY